jgi:phosphoribosylformimino-5-aminoimidazole carboxamide ribonucleotide (ProFAR) isomerase
VGERRAHFLAIAEFGDRIAVGLDVRGTTLAARGWTKEGGELFEVLARLDRDGCARYVVTDVTKDGTLTGPNLQLLRDVCGPAHSHLQLVEQAFADDGVRVDSQGGEMS